MHTIVKMWHLTLPAIKLDTHPLWLEWPVSRPAVDLETADMPRPTSNGTMLVLLGVDPNTRDHSTSA